MARHVYNLLLEDGKTEVIDLGDGKGKQFVKQIVRFGKWVSPIDPDAKMNLDKSWAEKIVENFKSKVIGRVAVPLSHTDLPEFNTGEVQGLDIRDDGLYATLDIRDEGTAQKIDKDLIWDVSVQFDNDYQDKKSGKVVGPTLFHVALVNNPYLKGMKPFEALSEAFGKMNKLNAIMLSEGDNTMAAPVKNVQQFPVTVKYQEDGEDKEVTLEPDQEVEVPEEAGEAVRAQIADATAPEAPAEPDAEPGEPEAPEGAPAPAEPPAEGEQLEEGQEAKVGELEAENERLRNELSLGRATQTYDTLLGEGKIVPAQKDAFMALSTAPATAVSLSDGSTKSSSDLLADLFKAMPKRISFSEEGAGEGENEQTPYDKLSDQDKEVQRKLGVERDAYNTVNAEEVTVN